MKSTIFIILWSTTIIVINAYISILLVREAAKMAYDHSYENMMGMYKIIGKILGVDVEKILQESKESDKAQSE